MYNGKKFVVLSTSNAIGGVNHTSFLVFLGLSVLLFMASLVLFFIQKRNGDIKTLAVNLRNKEAIMSSSLMDDPSMMSQEAKENHATDKNSAEL